MSKRLKIGLLVAVALVGATLAFPAPRAILVGWLRGEPCTRGRPLSYWADRAKAEDSGTRAGAIVALGALGPAAVPALSEALKHPSDDTRWSAASALGELGPAAEPAIPALVETIREGRALHPAVRALGQIGPAAAVAVPDLLDCYVTVVMVQNHGVFRNNVLESLVAIGPAAVPRLIEALDRPLHQGSDVAIEALGKIGPAARDALPVLIQFLVADDYVSRRLAAETIVLIAPESLEDHKRFVAIRDQVDLSPDATLAAVPALTRIDPKADEYLVRGLIAELQSHHHVSYQLTAVRILGGLGPVAKDAVPFIVAFLRHPDATINPQDAAALRQRAAMALGKIGTGNAETLPALIEALKDDVTVAAAAIGLADLGQAAEPAVPALLEALKRVEKFRHADRIELLNAIKAIGPKAETAVPQVLEMCWSYEDAREVKEAAREALVSMGNAAVPALETALKEQTRYDFIRVAAAEALFRIKRDSKALDTLAAIFRGKDGGARRDAEESLVRLGVDAVPLLTQCLSDENVETRTLAADALGEIGPAAKSATKELDAARKHSDDNVRLHAARALWKVARDPAAITTLIEVLEKQVKVSYFAAISLGEIGPEAKAAVPALMRIHRSGNGPYQEARTALKAIDPEAAKAAGIE